MGIRLLIVPVLFFQAAIGSGEANGPSFQIDASAVDARPIGNRFGNVSVWSFLGTSADERMFHEWSEAKPAGWLNEAYPWLEEIQVFIASGGAYLGYPRREGDTAATEFDRDLFKDPSDRSVLDDYDFSSLVRACHNMLRQGVKPVLKLHSVPLKYSSPPDVDWFRVNTRPPDDHRVYAEYISALVQAMVDAFGRPEVSTWRWYVGTEFENRTWWEAADETPESTAHAFLEFYDWSVFAVERVLGAECGPIGSHAMMAGGIWDPEIFFEHCATGKNFATGKSGTRLDFFAVSHYDRTAADLNSIKESWPELEGTGNVLASLDRFRGGVNIPANANLSGFEDKVARTRKLLDKHGFGRIPIEVSEGGMIYGTDGKWLWHGLARGGAFDASWTALSFKKMLDLDVALWSRWPLYRTSGLYSGAELAATNALRLIHRMVGDRRIPVRLSGHGPASEVVASVSPNRDVLRVLAFNHAPNLEKPNPTETVELDLRNLPFDGTAVVTVWRVDKDHADFWPHWERDRAAHGITDADYYQSRDQPDPVHALLRPEHIAFWRSRESAYSRLAELDAASIHHRRIDGGRLNLNLEMPCYAVALVEVREKR